VVNVCGDDPDCIFNGSAPTQTVSVIDERGNRVVGTATIGVYPTIFLANLVTDEIYAVNICASDPTCFYGSNNTIGTLNAINGKSFSNRSINLGLAVQAAAVNMLTNEVYVVETTDLLFIHGKDLRISSMPINFFPSDVEVNPLTYEIYVVDNSDNVLVRVDGVTHKTSSVGVGMGPTVALVNPVTNRIYVMNSDNTVSVVAGGYRH
jgi:DNA-binding beta-propeller fold protein YncE